MSRLSASQPLPFRRPATRIPDSRVRQIRKPTNILFDAAGHARLTDFAMVWPADAAQKQESRTDRTVYMAPEEQAGGNLGDPRSDVYSLGMCALYALLGKELTAAMVMDRAALIEQLDAPPPLKEIGRAHV